MGHKVHPGGFRLGITKDWQAKWFAPKAASYLTLLQEDLKLRSEVLARHREAAVSRVEIERGSHDVRITIHTARPGIVIGRGGQRVDETRRALEAHTGKRVRLDIEEIRQPELDAHLVARNIADQIERRVSYRRAMKQAVTRSMQAGAKGIKIRCAGRLAGAEIARKEWEKEGRVPLHTLRADIDYGLTEAHTIMGRIGVKVWIYKGDILPEVKPRSETAEPAEQPAPQEAPAHAST